MNTVSFSLNLGLLKLIFDGIFLFVYFLKIFCHNIIKFIRIFNKMYTVEDIEGDVPLHTFNEYNVVDDDDDEDFDIFADQPDNANIHDKPKFDNPEDIGIMNDPAYIATNPQQNLGSDPTTALLSQNNPQQNIQSDTTTNQPIINNPNQQQNIKNRLKLNNPETSVMSDENLMDLDYIEPESPKTPKTVRKLEINVIHFFIIIFNFMLLIFYLILMFTSQRFLKSLVFQNVLNGVILGILGIDAFINIYQITQKHTANGWLLLVNIVFIIVFVVLYFGIKTKLKNKRKRVMGAIISFIVINIFFWGQLNRYVKVR